MSMPPFPFARTMPVLTVEDMGRSLAFWRDRLGFSAATWGEPPTFAIVQRGTVSFGLATRAVRRNWTAYVYVEDVDRLYGELLAHGIDVKDPPSTQPYNCRDIVVDDPDGHLIAFGQVLAPDAIGPGLSERVGRDDWKPVRPSGPDTRPTGPWTGGCQCGAVRFRVADLGRGSHCHCRMCQKAFGAVGGTLVTARGLEWTRGARKLFRSSNKVQRGFCGDCGTPLTFEVDGGETDVAIPAFDRAGEIWPVIQLDHASRLPWFDGLAGLPVPGPEEAARKVAWYSAIESRQWPDGERETTP